MYSALTPAPEVTFTRDSQGNITADADFNPGLVSELLAHAGFTGDADIPFEFPSLPADLGLEATRQALAYANHMLTAARYVATMPPELKTIHGHAERFTYRLSPTESLEAAIEDLSNSLSRCEDVADIARVADTIFNEGEGVLISVENFARTAAHKLAAFDTEEAGALADRFLSISRRLDTITSVYAFIGEDLLDLHDSVSAAQSSAVPPSAAPTS
ncbi:hypothetical protein ACIGZJ_33400 [Kitasatospora sp. NPDC052868]|uniref:hypothetical protein n=1 Tax=Kitasatospora sp. NPDC052868 TaxID=3364060 RepID=UPI0037C5E471